MTTRDTSSDGTLRSKAAGDGMRNITAGKIVGSMCRVTPASGTGVGP